MTVAANDVLRCTVEGEGITAQDIQNVFHIQNTDIAVDEADALDDIIEILEVLYKLLDVSLSVLYVVRGVRVVNVTQGTDVGFLTFVDTTPGTGVGGSLPPQVALGLTLTTAALKSVGRKFFGLADEAQIGTDGLLNATALADVGDVGDHMTTEQVATNTSWKYGLIQSVGGAFLEFLSFIVTTTVITQRRRRAGVGS